MIQSFKYGDAKALFPGVAFARCAAIRPVAERKL